MSAIVFDIETGPRRWTEIEQFYTPPESLPPWNESMVRYGQTKDPAKRKEKYDKVKADYDAKLAIEKVDHENKRLEWLGRAALSPVTGCVLAIGLRGENGTAIIGEDEDSESQILDAWWHHYKACASSSKRLIGFNIFGFDLPFLIRRSWFHGIPVPQSVLQKNRYWADVFVDLMAVWGCGVWNERVSLDTASRFFGIGGKPDDVGGGDFARLWLGTAEQHKQAAGYLRNDLKMTWKLGERMGVI